MTNSLTILLLTIVFEPCSVTAAGKVKMRIVHDTANYGFFGNNAGSVTQMQLATKVKPANFSGPLLLKQLIGNCYNTSIGRYDYVFCPFQNMTQYETVPRWNAYQGVLGVWGYWKIENNNFVSMILTHGDTCGEVDRTIEVILECGRNNELLNVTEPKNCHYVASFATRLLCHNDSLLVYPRLEPEFQEKWDRLWTDYKLGYVSEKGYNNSLAKMFHDIGLTSFKANDANDEKETQLHVVKNPGDMNDLNNCKREYEKLKEEMDHLKEEIDSLKVLLDLNKVRSPKDTS